MDSGSIWTTLAFLVVTFISGGLFGQFIAWRQQSRVESRLRKVVAVDRRRLESIADHNARTIMRADSLGPKALIRFPVQPFLGAIYSGRASISYDDDNLNAWITYIHQAEHVNKMIQRFEDLEPLPASRYVLPINDYCTNVMPKIIQDLR